MPIPGRSGHDTPTDQTQQYVLNYSFDEVFKILTVGLVAYNPATNSMDRVQLDASGGIKANDSVYAQKITVSGSITYIASAAPGSAQAAAVWQVKKIDESVAGTTVITWADGDGLFNNVATNLATLSYS